MTLDSLYLTVWKPTMIGQRTPARSNTLSDQIASESRAIGYAQCELDVWDVVESLGLPLPFRLELITRFNEARKLREVTDFQVTESDINGLL
jgi:hypothetical protein